MKNLTEVKLTNGGNKIVATYYISKVTIGENARRLKLLKPILEDDSLDEFMKNTRLTCASLVCSLYDKDGELLYPGDDAVDKMLEDLDFEVFDILCSEYSEINPLQSTLKAKKKKS